MAGVVFNLFIVYTALTGLAEVEESYVKVAQLTQAQRHLQDADRIHDALQAGALRTLLRFPMPPGEPVTHAVEQDAAAFQQNLALLRGSALPTRLKSRVSHLRPLQDKYVADVVAFARLARSDQAAAQKALPPLIGEFTMLTDKQAALAAALSDEADALRKQADDNERAARWRTSASAVAAILGLLSLTYLMNRLGSALAAMVARQRGVAETLQQSLLPEKLPDVPGVLMAARYVPGGPSTQVGGDWYDVIPLTGGDLGLVMGDVVGHDVRAASVMGQLRNALRAYAVDGLPPGEVLYRLNRLCLQQEFGEMATCLYAVLNPVTGTLRLANAGHYPPLLLHDTGERYLEHEACPPIGAMRGTLYAEATHVLPPDSVLVLYTDGLVERRGEGADDGLDRLLRCGASARGNDIDQFCATVVSDMLASGTPTDDVAMLAVSPQSRLGPHLDFLWPAHSDRLLLLRRTLQRWLREAGASDQECYEITLCCSEAATNAIEHAYGPGDAQFGVSCDLDDGLVTVGVRDWGRWRASRGRDRGRGLSLVSELMEQVDVAYGAGGTEVVMRRRLAGAALAPGAGGDRS
ncbi:MAG TPA: ATP-binding SpoIIE family protein phosphatase [Dermatophilaceae bacterium]|nr:ATP-binding SpoIIE family protein phosphatase [Dermatophilaceae bacterium]